MCLQCHYDLLRAILRGFNTLSIQKAIPLVFYPLEALKNIPHPYFCRIPQPLEITGIEGYLEFFCLGN